MSRETCGPIFLQSTHSRSNARSSRVPFYWQIWEFGFDYSVGLLPTSTKEDPPKKFSIDLFQMTKLFVSSIPYQSETGNLRAEWNPPKIVGEISCGSALLMVSDTRQTWNMQLFCSIPNAKPFWKTVKVPVGCFARTWGSVRLFDFFCLLKCGETACSFAYSRFTAAFDQECP